MPCTKPQKSQYEMRIDFCRKTPLLAATLARPPTLWESSRYPSSPMGRCELRAVDLQLALGLLDVLDEVRDRAHLQPPLAREGNACLAPHHVGGGADGA